jgi:hypothetical protein
MPFFWLVGPGHARCLQVKTQNAAKVKRIILCLNLAIRPASRKIAVIYPDQSRAKETKSRLVIYPQKRFCVAFLSVGHEQDLSVICRPAQRTVRTVGNIARLFWTNKRLALYWRGPFGTVCRKRKV